MAETARKRKPEISTENGITELKVLAGLRS